MVGSSLTLAELAWNAPNKRIDCNRRPSELTSVVKKLEAKSVFSIDRKNRGNTYITRSSEMIFRLTISQAVFLIRSLAHLFEYHWCFKYSRYPVFRYPAIRFRNLLIYMWYYDVTIVRQSLGILNTDCERLSGVSQWKLWTLSPRRYHVDVCWMFH